MSVESSSIRKVIRDELLVILFVFLFITSIQQILYLGFGWIGLILYPPSLESDPDAFGIRTRLLDSDNDRLPDIIESSPKGTPVEVDGVLIGKGTGTDPFRKDSDFDLFTDTTEDKLGTNPNSFWDLGWFWVVWGVFLLFALYWRYIYKPDRLKQYERNEKIIRSGGTKGKFAYALPKNMTPEEKEELIKNDPRFKEITNMYQSPVRHKSARNKSFTYLIYGFVIVMASIIGFAITNF